MIVRSFVWRASILVILCLVATGLAVAAEGGRDTVPGLVSPTATVHAVPGSPAAMTSPEAAAITLVKTVGTVPAVCAGTTSITVAAGTEVYYCYTVGNTGDVALNFHDLVDDQLGTLLDALPYTLAPGASAFALEPATPMSTVTNTATWTAVTSLAGYVADDTIAVDFEDISATGTAFTLADDAVSAAIPLGFAFEFFGVAQANAYVSSNGFVSFDSTVTSGCCTGQAMPDPATPNNVVAGWWEDLDPGEAGAALYYQTLGTAPNRRLVIQFSNVQHYPSGNAVTMEYKFFETSNNIEVHYQAAPSDGGTHAAGIENADGSIGVLYYRGTAALTTPLAIRYSLLSVESATATASATVTVQASNMNADPLALASTQLPDTTAQRTLTVGNTGDLPLTWNLIEEPIARAPQAIGPGDATVAREVFDPANTKPGGDCGTPAPLSTWRTPEAVLYDNGPLVTHPGGGAGGADASAVQTALAMSTYGFGFQVSAGNRIADDFTVTGGGWFVEEITFFGYQTGSTTTSTFTAMNLQIWDGPPNDPASSVVFGDTTTNRMTGSVWSNIYRVLDTTMGDSTRPIMANTVAVNAFLPAGTYWLDYQANGSLSSGPWAPPISILGQTNTGDALQYTTTGWAALVDGTFPQGLPFVVEGTSDCSNPSDVPWLSANPINGVTAAGGSTPVTVTFDSTGLAIGTYDARLCLFSDDPDTGPGNGTNLVVIPTTLTVSTSAPGISVTKTVGTVPGVCAATSSISVPAGTTVYYCYTVTNTGDLAFNLHDLVDDQLGTIFTGLNYALAPGASVNTVAAGLSIPAVIDVTTTNVGTWTAYNQAPGDGAQAQATALVQVIAAESIPTLSELGLVLLGILLAAAGVLALRRHS